MSNLSASPTTDTEANAMLDRLIHKNATEYQYAIDSGCYELNEDDIRACYDDGWSAFAAECESKGFDAEEVLRGVINLLLD